MRQAAALSLSEVKQPGSAQLLLPHLAHDDPFVKTAVLRAVRELRSPHSYAPALAALADRDASGRREAVSVLGYLKQP